MHEPLRQNCCNLPVSPLSTLFTLIGLASLTSIYLLQCKGNYAAEKLMFGSNVPKNITYSEINKDLTNYEQWINGLLASMVACLPIPFLFKNLYKIMSGIEQSLYEGLCKCSSCKRLSDKKCRKIARFVAMPLFFLFLFYMGCASGMLNGENQDKFAEEVWTFIKKSTVATVIFDAIGVIAPALGNMTELCNDFFEIFKDIYRFYIYDIPNFISHLFGYELGIKSCVKENKSLHEKHREVTNFLGYHDSDDKLYTKITDLHQLPGSDLTSLLNKYSELHAYALKTMWTNNFSGKLVGVINWVLNNHLIRGTAAVFANWNFMENANLLLEKWLKGIKNSTARYSIIYPTIVIGFIVSVLLTYRLLRIGIVNPLCNTLLRLMKSLQKYLDYGWEKIRCEILMSCSAKKIKKTLLALILPVIYFIVAVLSLFSSMPNFALTVLNPAIKNLALEIIVGIMSIAANMGLVFTGFIALLNTIPEAIAKINLARKNEILKNHNIFKVLLSPQFRGELEKLYTENQIKKGKYNKADLIKKLNEIYERIRQKQCSAFCNGLSPRV